MEVLDKQQSAVAEYAPFYAQLAELEEKNTSLVFDYESKKGNKEARSHIFKLRQTKGALEAVRKQVKADILIKGRAIDSEKAAIESRIEAMITVHQAEIDKIEKRESDRIDAIQLRLGDLYLILAGKTADEYRAHIAAIEAVAIDDSWQEFVKDAAQAKDRSLTEHRRLLAEREKQDAEAAELARLRAEAAAREQKDREEAIAAEATEKARREAVLAMLAAEAKATAEREAGERRELELKLAAENAERRRVEAEQKAAQDAIDAAAKAEKDRLRAIQDEKDRVAAVEAAEALATAKREANKAHKAKINRTALAALVDGGLSDECARQCITLIASGKVPAVAISY